MKKITRLKQVVNKLASVPTGSIVDLNTYYSSFKGYLHTLPREMRNAGELGGKYMLATDDQKYMNVTEFGINGLPETQQTKRRVRGSVLLKLDNRAAAWYPLEWKSNTLCYRYPETDFSDTVLEYKEMMIVSVEASDDNTDVYSGEVVLTRDNAMVVEINGCLITFVADNAADEGIMSQCGEYFLPSDGGTFVSDNDDNMKLVGL